MACASVNHLIYPPGSKLESVLFFQKQGPDLVIHQAKLCLDNMGTWCQEHHAASGKQLTLSTSFLHFKHPFLVQLPFQ